MACETSPWNLAFDKGTNLERQAFKPAKNMNPFPVGRHYLVPVLFLLFLCAPHTAQACSCAPYPADLDKAVAMAYAQADVIFLGDATAMRKTTLGNLGQLEVTFSVRDRWKGSIPDSAIVRTNIGEIACGFDFRKQESYLVFAYRDQQQQYLTTSFCDLTRNESDAADAIGALDRITKRSKAATR